MQAFYFSHTKTKQLLTQTFFSNLWLFWPHGDQKLSWWNLEAWLGFSCLSCRNGRVHFRGFAAQKRGNMATGCLYFVFLRGGPCRMLAAGILHVRSGNFWIEGKYTNIFGMQWLIKFTNDKGLLWLIYQVWDCIKKTIKETLNLKFLSPCIIIQFK